MLQDDRLIVEVPRLAAINQRLPVLLLLAHLEQPAKTRSIGVRAVEIGFRKLRTWNVTDILRGAATAGQVAQLPDGWRLLQPGIESLISNGIQVDAPLVTEVRHNLRKHLDKVVDQDRRRFLGEAISCLDAKSNRAAIVMAWIGAAHILQDYVARHHLVAFNTAGVKRFPKYRKVESIKDFGRFSEAEFLLLCEDAGLLSKSEKQELEQRLGLRNRSGHPNSLVFGEHVTAAHIESLTTNVYAKY